MLYLDPNAVFSARLKGTFVPYAEPPSRDGRLMYRPALVAGMQLRFDEEKAGFIRDVEVTPDVIDMCKSLRQRGYAIALDDFVPGSPAEALVPREAKVAVSPRLQDLITTLVRSA